MRNCFPGELWGFPIEYRSPLEECFRISFEYLPRYNFLHEILRPSLSSSAKCSSHIILIARIYYAENIIPSWWLRHLTFLIENTKTTLMLMLCRLMCAESSGLFSGTRTTPGRHVKSLWMTRSWSHFPSVLRPGSCRSGGGCRDDVLSTTPLMRRVSILYAVQSSWKWFNLITGKVEKVDFFKIHIPSCVSFRYLLGLL